jgi:hypothetical protein
VFLLYLFQAKGATFDPRLNSLCPSKLLFVWAPLADRQPVRIGLMAQGIFSRWGVNILKKSQNG